MASDSAEYSPETESVSITLLRADGRTVLDRRIMDELGEGLDDVYEDDAGHDGSSREPARSSMLGVTKATK